MASPSSASSPARPLRKGLIALCLLAGLAAAGYSLWFWHQSARPGMAAYLKGLDYANARQFDKARAEWLRGTREDPSFPQCWEQLGDLSATFRQYPYAAHCYETETKLLPHDGQVWLKLARMEQASGQSAIDAARRAAVLLPRDADAQSLDGFLESDLLNRSAGLAAMRRANALRPGDSTIVRELAQQEINASDIVGAERDLAPFAKSHPQDAEAAYLMAVLALAKPPTPPNLQTGLHYAQIACAAEPNDRDCHSVLGQLYLNAHQPQKALQAFLAGERIDPVSEKILVGLVASYTRTGNAQAAAAKAAELQQVALRHNDLRHLVDVLKMNPTDVASRLRYARLLTDDGQVRPAQVQYERCVREFPRDPRTHPALAAFFRRLGFPDMARRAERADYVP